MINVLLISLVVITFILVAALVWVVLEQKNLKQDYAQLSNNIERHNKDIAGLCSAAVSVDNRISENNEQLKAVVEQDEPQLNHSYDSAIQRVRSGESVEDLVRHCGLSREEAELLIRLHG
jgi:hypothetical protein